MQICQLREASLSALNHEVPRLLKRHRVFTLLHLEFLLVLQLDDLVVKSLFPGLVRCQPANFLKNVPPVIVALQLLQEELGLQAMIELLFHGKQLVRNLNNRIVVMKRARPPIAAQLIWNVHLLRMLDLHDEQLLRQSYAFQHALDKEDVHEACKCHDDLDPTQFPLNLRPVLLVLQHDSLRPHLIQVESIDLGVLVNVGTRAFANQGLCRSRHSIIRLQKLHDLLTRAITMRHILDCLVAVAFFDLVGLSVYYGYVLREELLEMLLLL